MLHKRHFVVYNKKANQYHKEWIYVLTESKKIEEFLKDYKRSRVIIEGSVRASINRALEHEKKFNKAFYQFTSEEVSEMYKSIDAISVRSLQNMNLTLKHAARYILHSNGQDIKNIYDDITKESIQECVNTEKKKGLIISREDLTNIQNELFNDTDKAILEALFLGFGGHWLKELTFFSMSQINRQSGVIYFKTGKTISIDEDTYELIKRACAEDELLSFGETMRISRVKSHGFFKERSNALSASDDPNDEQDLERRFRFIQRRLLLMSKEFGIQLTSSNLQTSGLLHHLQQGIKETGLSFREYTKTEDAAQLSKRYDLRTALYTQVLVEKFEEYFQ